jgi:hypothetical protein
VGTTAKGEYLPTWVQRMPDVPTFDAVHTAGDSVIRLSPETLPEGGRIIRADYGSLDAVIELETPTPFQARYQAFYYPGWQVQVDGNGVPIVPTDPEGLISFEVPAGRHLIHVHFGETPLRLTANVTSLLSAVALATILTLIIRPTTPQAPNIQYPISNLFFPTLALVVLITKVAILDHVETPLRRANLVDGRLRDVDAPAEITFGDEFLLLGHDALPEHVPSGEQIEITTYWRALQPGGPDYGVTINIVDAQGHHWNSPDIRPSRWHRTPPRVWEWSPDQYAIVVLSVPLLPGTPPGTYTVEVVAFDHGTLGPLTAHDADGRAIGPALALGQVSVSAPLHPADPDALGIRQHLDASHGPLTLVGADFDRDRAGPGDPILLTTWWRADRQPPEDTDLTLHLALLGPDGSLAEGFDLPPTTAWHPTSLWEVGDVWRGQHLLHLPANLDDGDHTWHLTLRLAQRPISPATDLPTTLTITAPDRTFAPPPVDIETSTRLGNIATLFGANLQPPIVNLQPGDTLTTTLVWRAERETRISYHVFLHLLGPDGTLVAQSDGIPAGWTRPTAGWLPGEYVTDVHVLGLPAATPSGDYTLLAGLYVPGGERVTTPDGADAIPLVTIPVGNQ